MFGAIKSAMGMKPKPVMGQPPQMGAALGGMKPGLGPSNPMMSQMAQNVGSIGGMMGGRNMTRPPIDTGIQAPPDMIKPDVMPQTGGEEAIGNIQGLVGQMNQAPPSQGLGPSPRMMPRRPMMNPRMRQPMM